MIARLTLSLVLPALIAAIGYGAEVFNLGLIETLAAASLIIGFAVAAAGWTITSEMRPVRLICSRAGSSRRR
ncbi:ribosome biogenesis protein Tsr3 [Bradyrhizobium sp. USDA 4518]